MRESRTGEKLMNERAGNKSRKMKTVRGERQENRT
jgi:hypothetical protein